MPKPDVVFHYTNSEALQYILVGNDESSLRATGIRYLNDQSELLHGVERVRSVLECRRSELNLNDKLVDDLLSTFEEATLEKMGFNHFVACFSQATDLVDQWRGYGENGLGFALGYSIMEIANKFKNFTNMTFAACLYNVEDQEATLIREVNNSMLDLVKVTNRMSLDEVPYKNNKAVAVQALRTHLLLFKHSAYKQEREWRIIINPHYEIDLWEESLVPDIQFRSSRRGLVPFVTMEMPVPKILKIGPSEYQIENCVAAKMLLESKGIRPDKDIKVVVEDIPYRG